MPTVKYRTVIQWEADVGTGKSRVLKQFTMVDTGYTKPKAKKEPETLKSEFGDTVEM